MHIDNFFFKAVRAEILAESSSEGGEETSFEDIGRMIGQRWRNISEEGMRHCVFYP